MFLTFFYVCDESFYFYGLLRKIPCSVCTAYWS